MDLTQILGLIGGAANTLSYHYGCNLNIHIKRTWGGGYKLKIKAKGIPKEDRKELLKDVSANLLQFQVIMEMVENGTLTLPSGFQDEMKLSVSEIISKRFKDKIKIQEATSPSEVEKLIIRPPEAANSEFENQSLAFLGDPKGVWIWSELFGAHFRNITDDMAQYMKYKQQRIMSLA